MHNQSNAKLYFYERINSDHALSRIEQSSAEVDNIQGLEERYECPWRWNSMFLCFDGLFVVA